VDASTCATNRGRAHLHDARAEHALVDEARDGAGAAVAGVQRPPQPRPRRAPLQQRVAQAQVSRVRLLELVQRLPLVAQEQHLRKALGGEARTVGSLLWYRPGLCMAFMAPKSPNCRLRLRQTTTGSTTASHQPRPRAEAHSIIVPLRRSFQGGWEALGPNAEAF
jgi:hypothetical protein